jgi:hypothetical protein
MVLRFDLRKQSPLIRNKVVKSFLLLFIQWYQILDIIQNKKNVVYS